MDKKAELSKYCHKYLNKILKRRAVKQTVQAYTAKTGNAAFVEQRPFIVP